MANLILEKEIKDENYSTHVRYIYALRNLDFLIGELQEYSASESSSKNPFTDLTLIKKSNYDNLLDAINSIEELYDHLRVFTQEISAKQEVIRDVESFMNTLERDHKNQLKSL
jgi:hypothetical protein